MSRSLVATLFFLCSFSLLLSAQTISGELKKWHKVTLTFEGPDVSETADPNPFLDYRLDVTFSNGTSTYVVPGYYAADGNAGETSASSGNKWRVHFAPDAEGNWTYTASFRTGPNVAVGDVAGAPTSFDGLTGSFAISPTDKAIPDNRARGRLEYVGMHHLRYAETGEYFIKIGPDSPENLLAYEDIDNTPNNGNFLKDWAPHLGDWESGDPVWQGTKGKGLIGAINYLESEGQNVISFLSMNINGDDENVFPYIDDSAAELTRLDCSKLDQWEIIFSHADSKGFYLHFLTQEQENDQLMDGGALGTERKLYYRELIARFGHHLALNWNMGEENSNTTQQQKDFAQFFHDNDPYRHHVVIHTRKFEVDDIYATLVGSQSKYTGASMMVNWDDVHSKTLTWVQNSAAEGKKWVVSNDEQSPATIGVPDDGFTGTPSQADIRHSVLWGNLMAGGAGVEYYFGYQLSNSDLTCQDFRSRDLMWDYNRFARDFFYAYVDFWEMNNHNELIGNNTNDNSKYCLAKPGSDYLIYLPAGGNVQLDLENYNQSFQVRWFNPRLGGALQFGDVTSVTGPGNVNIGSPPADVDADWAVLVTVDPISCPPAGTSCSDGDPTTFNDEEDGSCNCVGIPCPPAGTACDDGNPDTENDTQDGFCNCAGTNPNSNVELWLEAECADVGANWSVVTDIDASNEEYLLPPDGNNSNSPSEISSDQVIFTFSVAQTGTYKVFARTMTLAGNGDSFWVRGNDGTWNKWNNINQDNYGPVYQWEQVGNWTGGNGNDPVTFDFQAGTNTITFAGREPGARLDKIFITLEGDIPTDMGPEPNNGCIICPPAGTACNDDDPSTYNDVEDGNCNCVGTDCPPAGTACDDGDASTTNDVEDGNCNCAGTDCPPAGTACDDGNASTTNDVEDGNCNCAGTDCPPAGTACDDGDASTTNDVEDGNCNCAGTDCPPAGTACDDGDASTTNDVEDGNCNCAGTDCPPAGTACDDGNASTYNDVEDGNCNCAGTDCPPAGTACDDGDPSTFNDTEDGNCNCAGTDCPPAGTACDDGDASTYNDLEDGNCNCAGTDCPPAGTACDDGKPDTTNDVEDGNCNCAGTDCPPAGTACDDGKPDTTNDVEDGNCNCVGTDCPPAGTACDDGDASTTNDVEDGNCNCAGTDCPPAGTACDDGDASTTNDVEDGNCNCAGTDCPPAGTACDDGDASTTNDVEDGNCNCAGTDCPPAGTACDDGDASTTNDVEDGNCNCAGTDCPPAGTACDDGDASTTNDVEDGNCNCAGTDCPPAGTACDDGDASTTNDVEDGNCNCAGTDCPPAGTACDDGDASTTNDVEDGNCNCAGTDCPPAGTACDDGDASTTNDVEDGNCNCAGTDCPPAGTACDDGDPNTENDVADGACNCSGTPAGNGNELWLEAECADVGVEWSVQSDGDASNDEYVLPPSYSSTDEPSLADGAWVTFTFTVSQAGTYRVFGRIMALNGDGDSFWVRANDGSWQRWNRIHDGNYGPVYQWEQVGDWNGGSGNDPVTFDLNAGINTIDFAYREPNTRLDKIFITLNGDIPTDMGPEPVGGCDGCLPAGTTCDDGDPGTINDVEDGNCNCAGTDCPPAGTACDDGDASTTNDVEDGNCNCAGTDCPPAGTACDDGDASTTNDVEDGNCNCAGTDCPPAGTACDDGDASTTNDVEDGNCNCAGTDCPPAGTACDDGDASTTNDVEDGNCNCAGTDCPPAGTACDDGDASTTNDVEDGNCNCAGTDCPPAGTACDDGDASTTNDVEDGNCNCAGTDCPPAGTACDDGDASTTNDVEDGNCNCVGTDCPPAGTACDDGDASTTNDVEDGNCNCVGTDCPPAGTACDDGDASTTNDVEDGNCNCVGTDCPPAGTACDDGDASTTNDVEDGNCNCAGTDCPPAGTACNDGDASTTNDVEDGNCNCAGTDCPPAGTACDDGDPNTQNDVEDGFCNCAGTPSNELWLEAECAIVGSQWTIETDPDASNDQYALPPNVNSLDSPPENEEDLVTFSFEVQVSGTYKVFARTETIKDKGDSFWVRANGGDWIRWNRINQGNDGSIYQWAQVSNWLGGSTIIPVTFDLVNGNNTIDFSWREPNARLDKIFITLDGDQPSDIGPEPTNGCIDCLPAGTACDDGDPDTVNDVEDGNCNCAGSPGGLNRVETTTGNLSAILERGRAQNEEPVPAGSGSEEANGKLADIALPSGDPRLLVFPNPATEEIFVRFDRTPDQGPVLLEILDALGKVRAQRVVEPGNSGPIRFEMRDWPGGMYWLRLKKGKVLPQTQPFILQRN